jgi:hypothetical protein
MTHCRRHASREAAPARAAFSVLSLAGMPPSVVSHEGSRLRIVRAIALRAVAVVCIMSYEPLPFIARDGAAPPASKGPKPFR